MSCPVYIVYVYSSPTSRSPATQASGQREYPVLAFNNYTVYHGTEFSSLKRIKAKCNEWISADQTSPFTEQNVLCVHVLYVCMPTFLEPFKCIPTRVPSYPFDAIESHTLGFCLKTTDTAPPRAPIVLRSNIILNEANASAGLDITTV